MTEKWVDIPNYEGYYQVSNNGKVRSLDRIIKGPLGQPKKQKGAILKPRLRHYYMSVRLAKNGIIKDYNIHRLVAISFLENPLNLPCINHKDENKLNNNVENLEWCSYAYNTRYGTCRERISSANKISHLGICMPKLEESNKSRWILLINKNEKIKGAKTASLKYGISPSNIIQCCRGKRKSAGVIDGSPAIWRYI